MGKVSAARYIDLTVQKKWYVIANRTEAVVYRDGPKIEFVFVDRLVNPEGRSKVHNLVSDRPGRVMSTGGQAIHHGLERATGRQDEMLTQFARRIAEFLKAARNRGDFSNLVLVAEPGFLGLLRGALDADLRDRVVFELNQELKRGSDQAIRDHIAHAMRSHR